MKQKGPQIITAHRFPRTGFVRDIIAWVVENERLYRATQDMVDTRRHY